MCAWITVLAQTEDGEPYPDAPEPLHYEGEGLGPDCTCPLSYDNESGVVARRALAEALMPFFQKVHWGNIVMQIR